MFPLYFKSFKQPISQNKIIFNMSSSELKYQSLSALKIVFLGGLVQDVSAKCKTEGGTLSSVLKLAFPGSPCLLAPQRSHWRLQGPFF